MPETYESGGILAALHSTNTKQVKKKKKKSSASDKDEESENGDILGNLFTKDEDDEEEQEADVLPTHFIVDKVTDVIVSKDEDVSKAKKKIEIKETAERLERTLFVGNIALTVSKKTLKKIFIKFGEIENIRFRSFVGADPKVPKKVAIIKKTFHSECKSMNAYIVYKSKESISKALLYNGTVVEGLHLRVDKASPEKKHENKHCLFIGNLPFNITEEVLHTHFEKCGEIEYVRVIRDKFSGMGKGFGYVTFKSRDGVVFGLKLNGSNLDGRAIRVYRADNSDRNKLGNFSGGKNSFCGLKSSTSKKDHAKGKKLVQEKMRTSKNAMRRMRGKVGSKKKKTSNVNKDKQKGFRNK